ncbi:hypothetical protein Micbo1qcDRAFT_155745 [Microdochium bolleyi]|uniref:Myb-like DNA-binding domain-containing protein n=1 Tax=Microdochium bolleyi TaxID=196109 RepID=A0A136JIM3_9PEZI|nr:hypothetical protein Micbo1qcDRAFT_155745 [Microdochium bolleyi]
MSSSNDNPMARFLFAILKQKNLKDIDWHEVARDPVLAEEISNGHAARMRYARFRDAMLGVEPTRRNRTSSTSSKSRVTKSKKETKIRKGDGSRPTSGIRIKEESVHSMLDSRMTPGLTPGSLTSTSPMLDHGMHQRLLTPTSDRDLFNSPPVPSISSPSDDFIQGPSLFDFQTSSCPSQDDSGWQQGIPYSAFSAAYHYDDFSTGAEAHHLLQPSDSHLGLSSQTGLCANVKNEEWDPYH